MFETDEAAEAWARDEWFPSYTPKAHDPKLYHDPEGLWAQLLPGDDGSPPAVRLLRLSWLLERAEQLRRAPNEAARRALALPRRQELERDHPEAFLTVEEVRALKRGFENRSTDPLRLLSISHAWAIPEHPDPLGATLVAFAEQVRQERRLCPGGALDSCAAAAAWAFACLEPQVRAPMAANPVLMCAFTACCPVVMGASHGCVCGCIPCGGQGCGRSLRALPLGEFAVFFECAAAHTPPPRLTPPSPPRLPPPALTRPSPRPPRVRAATAASCKRTRRARGRTPSAPRLPARCRRRVGKLFYLPPPLLSTNAAAASLGRAHPPTPPLPTACTEWCPPTMQMGSWYAHKLATTFSMSVAPAGSSATPYDDRGWTTFERAVSQLIKAASFDSWRQLADASVVRTVGPCGGAYIAPPMHPRAFAAVLARKVFTNGRSDCELVAGLYYDTLVGALGHAESLTYMNCGWGDEEVAKLAEVLEWAREATLLHLVGNPRIGRKGYAALAAALGDARVAPKLRKIVVDYPKAASATELRAACEARGIKVAGPGQ